jgi:hypothetical protein
MQMNEAQALKFAAEMDWDDIDVGLDTLGAALSSLGFRWDTCLRNDVKLFAAMSRRDVQLAAVVPQSSVCENGSPLCEFAVLASVFIAMQQVLRQVSADVGTPCSAVPMKRQGSNLTFVIGHK